MMDRREGGRHSGGRGMSRGRGGGMRGRSSMGGNRFDSYSSRGGPRGGMGRGGMGRDRDGPFRRDGGRDTGDKRGGYRGGFRPRDDYRRNDRVERYTTNGGRFSDSFGRGQDSYQQRDSMRDGGSFRDSYSNQDFHRAPRDNDQGMFGKPSRDYMDRRDMGQSRDFMSAQSGRDGHRSLGYSSYGEGGRSYDGGSRGPPMSSSRGHSFNGAGGYSGRNDRPRRDMDNRRSMPSSRGDGPPAKRFRSDGGRGGGGFGSRGMDRRGPPMRGMRGGRGRGGPRGGSRGGR